jgi:hypothetical protein
LAEQNINTNITATANFSALTAQLQAVTSELVKLQATTIGLNKNLSNQVGVMNKSFAETLRSTGQFSTHFVTLTSDVEKFGKNLDSGRMKLGQYFNTWQQHANKTSSIVKDLAKQQVLMELLGPEVVLIICLNIVVWHMQMVYGLLVVVDMELLTDIVVDLDHLEL